MSLVTRLPAPAIAVALSTAGAARARGQSAVSQIAIAQPAEATTMDPWRSAPAEATPVVHDEKRWLELFQEIIVYGTAKRASFRPRADDRLIVSEMALAG